jgi:4-amino-4-deoxy-L-arabinose transferase-like glycosyltransferase
MTTSRSGRPQTLDEWRQLTSAWLASRQPAALAILFAVAAVLRGLLVAFSPVPFGYVWDFYQEGVRLTFASGHLPASGDCWQCYHPPLFYLLGTPLYAFGRWVAGNTAAADASGLRWLGFLSMVSAWTTIYYGYRLLRLFRCRGATLVAGVSLLVSFPCLFISSYGTEADIVLTGILSAFIYYLTRDLARPRAVRSAVRMGALAGLAAATKYSGLIALVSALVLFGMRAVRGPRRALAITDAVVVIAVCAALGGWKYLDNYERYGTPLHANGTAAEGFAISDRSTTRGGYEFTTLRLAALMQVMGPRAPKGPLTDLPVYRSVITTLHALAWSDMSFFSEPSRHGDPSQPYPRKHIPAGLVRTVLVLGFVPELLAALGVAVTLRRRTFRPVLVFGVVTVAAYVWWFVAQDSWGLKTKYVLFLLPPFVVYAVTGLAWLWARAPLLSSAAGALLAALALAAHGYLLAFALG